MYPVFCIEIPLFTNKNSLPTGSKSGAAICHPFQPYLSCSEICPSRGTGSFFLSKRVMFQNPDYHTSILCLQGEYALAPFRIRHCNSPSFHIMIICNFKTALNLPNSASPIFCQLQYLPVASFQTSKEHPYSPS